MHAVDRDLTSRDNTLSFRFLRRSFICNTAEHKPTSVAIMSLQTRRKSLVDPGQTITE